MAIASYSSVLSEMFGALDSHRAARDMNWAQVSRALGVAASTLKRMRVSSGAEGDGVLRVLCWLRRTPESFIASLQGGVAGGAFPSLESGRWLRFDGGKLFRVLDSERSARGITWRHVADEIGDLRAGDLTRLAKGPSRREALLGRAGCRVGFPSVMRMAHWVGCPTLEFTQTTDW
jgi:hypothetical protein